MTTAPDARARYLALIDATLRHALADRPPPSPEGPLSVELALPAVAARLGLIAADDAAVEAAFVRVAFAPADAPVADRAGHVRPFYRPLLMRLTAPDTKMSRTFADYAWEAMGRATAFGREPEPPLVRDGPAVVARLFEALAVLALADHTGIDAPDGGPGVASAFARVVRHVSADGTFLARSSADQLEPAWYHELAVLHAIELYARRTGDASARAAVARSARYHAAEVQPDHASSHPFGLAALLDDPDGVHLADMMLHAAGVQQPATMDAVSLVLLFDAIDGERCDRASPGT